MQELGYKWNSDSLGYTRSWNPNRPIAGVDIAKEMHIYFLIVTPKEQKHNHPPHRIIYITQQNLHILSCG